MPNAIVLPSGPLLKDYPEFILPIWSFCSCHCARLRVEMFVILRGCIDKAELH